MKVVFLKDVRGKGRRFEEKEVSDGYATNFLLPQQLAVLADKAGVARARQLREQSAGKKAIEGAHLSEKEAKRLEKHEALEKFRQSQLSTKLKPGRAESSS